MTDKLLDIIRSKYSLVELDVGEYDTLKANGMRFCVKAYRADGLGHVYIYGEHSKVKWERKEGFTVWEAEGVYLALKPDRCSRLICCPERIP